MFNFLAHMKFAPEAFIATCHLDAAPHYIILPHMPSPTPAASSTSYDLHLVLDGKRFFWRAESNEDNPACDPLTPPGELMDRDEPRGLTTCSAVMRGLDPRIHRFLRDGSPGQAR